MTLRISSGIAKNRLLASPKIPGIRLTQEVARLAIFSILGEKINDTYCLDLYAGSGSLGLEALSRGAKWCDFVDYNEQAIEAIQKNLKTTAFEVLGMTHLSDVTKYVGSCTRKYDLIFMDPYYDQAVHKHVFKMLPSLLNEGAVLIFSHGKDLNLDSILSQNNLKITDERKYGESVITFLKLNPEPKTA